MITCGQRIWSDGGFRGRNCTREGLWTLKDDPTPQDVYCNVHKGAMNRRIYSTYDFKPLTDEQKTKVQRILDKEAAEQRAINAERIKEHRAAQERRRAAAWTALDLPATYNVKQEDRRWDPEADPRWEYRAGSGDLNNHWGSYPINLQTEEKGHPYTLRMSSTGTASPNEARAIAAALLEAADKADMLNQEKRNQDG